MTERERKQRRKIKKQLQDEGILPPDKPRMNRKRYIEETRKLLDSKEIDFLSWSACLQMAISEMLNKHEIKNGRYAVSEEAVGVARMLRLAWRIKEFRDKLNGEGRTSYTAGEYCEFCKDVYG